MMRVLIPLVLLAAVQAHAFPAECDVHFSPAGGVTKRLVEYIGSAKRSIRVLAYSFTSDPIAAALISAKRRGVDVQVVLDKSQPSANGGELPALLGAGVPVWVDSRHQIAHNKTIIIDSEWFETGSFNFTNNAELRNGENALVCKSQDGAAAYLADWQRHRDHSVSAK